MNIPLRTPKGALLINLTKVNGVDLRDNCIVILFTSEKANNLSFTYESDEDATKAFNAFNNNVDRQSF